MTGVGEAQGFLDRVIHGVDAGDQRVACQPANEAVEMPEQFAGRQVLRRVSAHGCAQLTHQRGGVHTPAHDVAHDQPHPTARQRDDVVPVTTYGALLRSRPVDRCRFQRRRRRKPIGEQTPLQREGDALLSCKEAGVVERDRCAVGDLLAHLPVGLVEDTTAHRCDEADGAEHLTAGDKGRRHGAADADSPAVLRGLRRRRDVLEVRVVGGVLDDGVPRAHCHDCRMVGGIDDDLTR